jgi:hypothetical protein
MPIDPTPSLRGLKARKLDDARLAQRKLFIELLDRAEHVHAILDEMTKDHGRIDRDGAGMLLPIDVDRLEELLFGILRRIGRGRLDLDQQLVVKT